MTHTQPKESLFEAAHAEHNRTLLETITIRDAAHLRDVLDRRCALCGMICAVDDFQYLNNELVHTGGACPDDDEPLPVETYALAYPESVEGEF